jgi:hypothetical protein
MDNNLSWGFHIEEIIPKLNKASLVLIHRAFLLFQKYTNKCTNHQKGAISPLL